MNGNTKKMAGYAVAGIGGWLALFKLYYNFEKKYTPAYRGSVIHAMDDPGVQTLLGTPIQPGYWIGGTVDPKKGVADLSVTLKGPKGEGLLEAKAEGKRRSWAITGLVLKDIKVKDKSSSEALGSAKEISIVKEERDGKVEIAFF
eukprot:Nk52_evm26s621 gene=Nk52_evmTU26s621